MRQLRERSASPNAIRPSSCCSTVVTASSPAITACARASSKLLSALGEVFAHQPHALEILPGVQPQTARRPRRAEQAVALRTGAQDVRADARALAELADPERCGRRHALTIQHLDRYLTKRTKAHYAGGGSLLNRTYIGGKQE